LDLVTDPAGRTYDHGYDPAGNRKSLAYPNGVTTTYNYDDLNRLRNLATTRPATGVTIQSYNFTLGPSGNRTKITEGDGSVREYGYDDLYRLISEKVTIGPLAQYDKAFIYDAVGNRTAQTTNGAGAAGTPLAAGSLTYGYDTRDRLETENGTLAGQPIGITYGYDDNGNLITKSGEARYFWDAENRLIRIETGPVGGATVVTYAYDADGNRLQTRVTPAASPSTATDYLVDPSGGLSHVVAETDDGGHLEAYYVRGNDLLAVMRPLVPAPTAPADWQTRFFHADGIGSIRRLTDESGALTDGYTYAAFGERIAHTGTDPQPYAFAGEPYDPNVGFQYLRARYYDSRTGRLATADVFPPNFFDPETLHRYVYVTNDPIDRIDPSGQYDTLAGLNAAVSVNQMLSFIQPTLIQGIIIFAGVQSFMKVGFELRNLGLEMMELSRNEAAWEGGFQVYTTGHRLIELGSFAIERGSAFAEILHLGVGALKFAEALHHVPLSSVWGVEITQIQRFESVAMRIDTQGLSLVDRTQGSSPTTLVRTLAKDFADWSEVIFEGTSLLFDITHAVLKHIYWE
jgi:RHS repeat-associated protein